MILIKIEENFESWRDKARQLLSQKIHPEEIDWKTNDDAFSFGDSWIDVEISETINVPRDFVDLARTVSSFRSPTTWPLLYRILYRVTYEDKDLLKNPLDSDIMEFHARARLVHRDIHKMKAFVRFKEVKNENEIIFMAWHKPDHRIVRLAAPFFKDRFNGMKWIIMTPDETANWDGENLTFTPGVSKERAPKEDDKEELWKTYYKSIFNPARIKINAMKKELPVRHWQTLPETELISGMLQEAPLRLQTFYETQKPAPVVNFSTLRELNEGMNQCRACGICEKANGPVSGAGPENARILVIGEQPGDKEDTQRKPFVGPAGKVLNKALELAGKNRNEMYLTNAVKGFKFIPKAHMRWHKGASISEITSCRPWLMKEIELVRPEIIICLGRSAALSVVGKLVKIEDTRGKFFETPYSSKTIILPHPASILRNKEDEEKAFRDFAENWKKIF